jgi:hypothetical protein
MMNTAIIPKLVKKDFMIMRKMILICCLVILASITVLAILYGRVSDSRLVNIASILLISPVGTCGIILLMMTNVFEKEKSTQSFIMSLPVTVKEFTIAKLLINLPVFSAMWLIVSGIAFYFCFSLGLLPLGTIPFLVMIFLGGFTAYTCILSTSLLFQSLGMTVLSIMIFQMGTSAYLWWIVSLDPIANNMNGSNIVWNSTAMTIITIQIMVIIFTIAATLFVQNKKRDFI